MGFSKSSYKCNKHPDHQENQGVCPSCLRERLSRLCSSSSSYKDSSLRIAPSSSFSPVENRWGSSSFTVNVDTNGFKKSRSVAFIARNDEEVTNNGGKKKKGFWSKLLRFKGKNDKDFLTHSSSMRFVIGRVN
ncbi:hypothetical protein Goari_005650 [Gossypium aridum]|uniref:Uncharacterized protein n=2 Tax=Gossypium TaxID=3633 RepID=A0A7J8YU10_GOSAI|nr:hypothetical protein [Gossypium aridum]